MRSAFASIEPQTTTPLTAQWLDLRLTSAIRLMLATSALLAFIIDPAQATRDPHLSGVLLGCFTIYCGVFLVLAFYRNDLIPSQIMHWFDMIWFQFLVYLTGGGASIFFTFFFFAILVASFGWGYKSGLRLTLATTIIFTVLSLQQAGWDQANKVMLRSIALLVLGFMISRWCGFRMSLRNRLQLLKDVTVVSNARFGTDRTITSILETLRGFFDADDCLLLIRPNPERDADYQIYRIRRGVLSTGSSPPHISARDARLFILPSSNHAMVYRQARELLTLIDINTKEASKVDPATGDRIANALEATSYMSVPIRNRNLVMGRLYVVGGPEHYDHSAVEVVIQLLDHVTPLIENIRLVDTLASYSAEEERRRIARDIHDSVIQPYIGLQLGIAAVAQKLRTGNMDVINDVEELSDLTNQELAALRGYVWGLRAGEDRRDVLMPAIERFVSRFSTVTGISVSVSAKGKIEVNDRLAAEIFHMVTEGLSNIRRHGLCSDASVELACHQGKFLLRIKNPRPSLNGNGNGQPNHSHDKQLFTPRSISERASLLGGKTEVSIDEKNRTVVQVAIPL